ncbi:MAG: 30S ribosomal protein S7 [Candidatus Woesearchaeota archaeon]
MVDIKVFNKWDVKGIEVKDLGLKDYINLEVKCVPKTGARYAKSRFHKSKTFIVERLINKVMVPGHKGRKHFKTSSVCTGKGNTAYNLVENALSIIEGKTKQNPVAVLAKAVENSAPREEIVTIEYGGARYPRATECGPQRRVDIALKHIAQGAYHRSFGKKIGSAEALASEIIDASNSQSSSNAVSKKFELERQVDSAR